MSSLLPIPQDLIAISDITSCSDARPLEFCRAAPSAMIFNPSVFHPQSQTLTLLIALWVGCALGASKGIAGTMIPNLNNTEQFFFDSYGMESGLPGVTVVAACQTHDGYLWVATGGGLARFDGVRSVSFRPDNTPAFLSALIYCLYEDREQTLWIGTSRGLVRYRDHVFERVGLDEAEIHTLAQDSAGRLWVGTYGKGLFVRENGVIAHCEDEALKGIVYILKLFADRSDRLWIGIDAPGLVVFEKGSFRRFAAAGEGLNDRVESICEQPTNTLWFGTRSSGLFRWKEGMLTRLGPAQGLANGEISDIQSEKAGGLWISGVKLQRLVNPAIPVVTVVPDAPHEGIFSMCEDREGGVWLCAKERGLMRAGLMPYRLISTREGLPDDAVRSIAEDAAGNLWFASQTHGLVRVAPDGSVTTPFVRSDDDLGPRPVSVLVAHDGAIWMGMPGAGAIRVHRDGHDKSFPEIRGAYGMFEDHEGTIWIGTVNDGIFSYRDNVFTAVTLSDGGLIPHATWFCEGPDKTIYAATWSSGFVRIKQGHAELFDRSKGLPTDEVRVVYVDSENRVWLGFRGHGLGLWENGGCWNPAPLAQALADHVSAIVEDAHGQFWFGTPAGVMWVAKSDLVAAARGEKDIEELRIARVNGSLRSASVWSGSQSVVAMTHDARLLFATRSGVLAIDPQRFPMSSVPPPVYLERVAVDGHAVPATQVATLAAGARTVAFDYAAPSFANPSQVLYKYQLDGYDTDWVEAKTRRSAYYSNLAPGRYTFRVIACNADGIWNTVGASLAVVQLPLFYQTRWFFGAAALAVLALGVGLNRWSNHRLKQRLERLEEKQAMEKERRRIAKNLHDDLGANLTEISLFTETIQQKITSPELNTEMTALSERVRSLAGTLDAIVWSANPANDSLDRLSTFVCGLFQDLCRMAGIRCRIDLPELLPACPLSPDERSNLFLAVREAMTNMAKHSGATEAWLRLKREEGVFQFILEDNGRGFDLAAAESGNRNGLPNIRSRVAELKGTVHFQTAPGCGATVILRVPIP